MESSRTTLTAAAIGIAALCSPLRHRREMALPLALGLVGFGIGAILGSMMGPPEVYFVPPPPYYDGPVFYGPPNYDGPVAYGPPHSYRAPPGSDRPRSYGAPELYRPRSYGATPQVPDRDGNRAYPRPKTPPPAKAYERRPAPTRSATAKTGRVTAPVKQEADARFKAVQAKAKRVGVQMLTQKDIEGLSYEQIKQLRRALISSAVSKAFRCWSCPSCKVPAAATSHHITR